jgi:ribosomal protein S18 acetylase RimI-like enzyme
MSVADGYSIRSPTEADAPAVAALITAADSDTGEVLSTGDVLDDWRRVDLEHDAWLATAPDGSAAGFLSLLADEPLHVESDGYVHPAHVGRGLGSELIRLAEERAVLKGAGVVRNATLSTNRAAIALLESCGYRPARRYYRMVVDLREQPAEPEWPPGLRPEAYDPRQAEAFHAVHEEAFADDTVAVSAGLGSAWTRRIRPVRCGSTSVPGCMSPSRPS